MPFPDIHTFPEDHPGPYERQMGGMIVALLRAFVHHVPDSESNAHVTELAVMPTRWHAGHALFNEVRHRLLAATQAKDWLRELQYHFEESCCQAMYNATDPVDPFDPGSAFFVAPLALGLARETGLPVEVIVEVLAPGIGDT